MLLIVGNFGKQYFFCNFFLSPVLSHLSTIWKKNLTQNDGKYISNIKLVEFVHFYSRINHINHAYMSIPFYKRILRKIFSRWDRYWKKQFSTVRVKQLQRLGHENFERRWFFRVNLFISFYAPRNHRFGGHLVFGLSVCTSVCLSKKTLTLTTTFEP